MTETLKTCTKCNAPLPLSGFHKESRSADGHQAWCKECSNEWRREYLRNAGEEILENRRKNRRDFYWNNRDGRLKAIRNTELKRKYGITLGQYTVLFEMQDGRCGLCGSSNPGFRDNFAVDHDHDAADVRGLLCDQCNRDLGIYEKMLRVAGSAKLEHWLSEARKAEVQNALGEPRRETAHTQSEVAKVTENVETCGQQRVEPWIQ
jgi:hypothetical protein